MGSQLAYAISPQFTAQSSNFRRVFCDLLGWLRGLGQQFSLQCTCCLTEFWLWNSSYELLLLNSREIVGRVGAQNLLQINMKFVFLNFN